MASEKTGLVENKRRREKKHFGNRTSAKESDTSTGISKGRKNFGARKFRKEKLAKGQPESSRKLNKKNLDKGPRGGQKRKMNKSNGAVRKPASASASGKRGKLGKS